MRDLSSATTSHRSTSAVQLRHNNEVEITPVSGQETCIKRNLKQVKEMDSRIFRDAAGHKTDTTCHLRFFVWISIITLVGE